MIGNIIVFNKTKENFLGNNVFYIGRGSCMGNKFTHISNKDTLAETIVETREKAIECYKEWLNKEYGSNIEVTDFIDNLFNLYQNGEVIYLECYCAPLSCHGDIIKEFIIKKSIKEQLKNKIKR